MKITVEYQGYPTDKFNEKTVVYETPPTGSWIDRDWDFLFECLGKYRDHLKLRAAREDSVGRQIDIQAKIDKLERLFKKYKVFIQMAEEGRYDL